VLFSAFNSRNNSCFTAGKRFGVGNFHATCGYLKTNVFTSIVYALTWDVGSLEVLSLPQKDVSLNGCRLRCNRVILESAYERGDGAG
jgi:hypothetical protein